MMLAAVIGYQLLASAAVVALGYHSVRRIRRSIEANSAKMREQLEKYRDSVPPLPPYSPPVEIENEVSAVA